MVITYRQSEKFQAIIFMNSAKNDNLEPELGTRNFEMTVRFLKFWENFRLQSGSHTLKTLLLILEFCCTHCQKLIIVLDTNYITSAIRKLMLDIPSPGGFENIDRLNMSTTEHVKPCGTSWVKIKGVQLKVNVHHLVVHQMLIKNCKRTMMIQCILTELLECKFHEKCLSPYVNTF